MGKRLQSFTGYLLLCAIFTAFGVPITLGQPPTAWINEIGPSPPGSGNGAFAEIVVASIEEESLSEIALTHYRADGKVTERISVDRFRQGETFGSYTFYHIGMEGMKHGIDGFALDYKGEPIHFVSPGGAMRANNGPAAGKLSQEIPESMSAGESGSLYLSGSGLGYKDFSWHRYGKPSPGRINDRQYIQQSTLKFSRPAISVSEGAERVSIPVTLAGPDWNVVGITIRLLESQGSARADDFIGETNRTVRFSPDEPEGKLMSLKIELRNDPVYEGDETAVFQLSGLSPDGAAIGLPDTVELSILDDDRPDVVINEIYADPGEDADRNGSRDGDSDDEFVELLNNENRPVDIGGWIFSDNGSEVRHTFPPKTVLPASGALVLFSMDPDGPPTGIFGDALVQVSDTPLQLDDAGDHPTLSDSRGAEIDSHRYGREAGENQSLVRSPEGRGAFVKHSEVPGSVGSRLSPGTRIDGFNFNNSLTLKGNRGWRLLSAPVPGMNLSDLADDVPIRGYPNYRPGSEKSFFIGYDGQSYQPARDIGKDKLLPGRGFLLFVDDREESGPLTLKAMLGAEQGSDVSVRLHMEGDKWNLLGNPFDTALDLSRIDEWTEGGSLNSSVVQVWDHESGSFELSTTKNGQVSPWQGFFIENADAVSLTIPTTARLETASSPYNGSASKRGYLALELKGEMKGDRLAASTPADKAAVLYFHERATHGWDRFDASKLKPLASQYALIGFRSQGSGGEGPVLKAQDSRPYEFEGEISYDVALHAEGAEGPFELNWRTVNLPDTWTFILTDRSTGAQVDMTANQNYVFNFSGKEKSAGTTSLSEDGEGAVFLPSTLEAQTGEDEERRFTIKIRRGSRSTQSGGTPETVKLNPNYPNPFNPTTTITYELAEQAEVRLNVYTIVGQKVATLVDGVREAGIHEESWSASDMPSGIYIAQLEVDGRLYIRKMTLIK